MNFSKRLQPKPTILILGGYGYGNVGDEAQLSADLVDLKSKFSNHTIKILTPNPSYTTEEHPGYQVYDAPRIAFYDHGKSKLYDIKIANNKSIIYKIGNWIYKMFFLWRSILILLNAYLIRSNIPPLFIRAERISLLNEIRKCDFVFFEGGGYLTGSTLSRLWDGGVFIQLAKVFKKKVFLSGQTIGVWGTPFNKWFARLFFRSIDLISVRDPNDSKQALLEIGLKENLIRVICDDALFCAKKVNLDQTIQGKEYITYHFHYWGCETNEDKLIILNKNVQILKLLLKNFNRDIVLLSMTPSDEEGINDLLNSVNSSQVHYFKHEYDFREIRGLISGSSVCITMKHHPIIFAIGEIVPVISISYKDYYLHKNRGALMMFGLEDFNVAIEDEDLLLKVSALMKKIEDSRVEFKHNLHKELANKAQQRKTFFEDIYQIANS